MNDASNSPTGDQITAMFVQAEEVSRQLHAARQRADDDASYANKAKISAEEHSKSVAALKGQAEADASWFTSTKQGVDQAQATINQIRAEAESAKQVLLDAIGEVERGRVVVKGGVEQVDALRAQTEKSAGDAAAHLKSAIASSSSAGVTREAATKAAEKIDALLAQVAEAAERTAEQAEKINEHAATLSKAQDTAQALVNSMAAADKKATLTLGVIEQHERDLARTREEIDALHNRIESLLPNATSAGLATAFREQKARFERPQWMWLGTFVATIVGLLTSSLWGLPAGDTWDSMGRHFVNRLPLIAPLIWLAIYAGRHYALALQLQEEYAYKEAVSAAFEGYKREMSTVAATNDGRSPLVTLCENVLRTLGQRPGRIYESKQEDITPMTAVVNGAKDAAAVAKDVVQAATTSARIEG